LREDSRVLCRKRDEPGDPQVPGLAEVHTLRRGHVSSASDQKGLMKLARPFETVAPKAFMPPGRLNGAISANDCAKSCVP